MAAGVRVLKIDVQVDDDGVARRNLAGVEQGVQRVETVGNKSGGALLAFSKNLTTVGLEAEAAADGVTAMSLEASAAAPILGTLAASTGVWTVAIGGVLVALAAVGELVRESTTYYVEQSGVLDVNRHAVDELKESWNAVKYAIGEATVGNSGDFTSWIQLVEAGLVILGVKFATDIALAKELASLVAHGGPIGDFLSNGMPGVATATKNPDGSMTAAGDLALFQENQEKRFAQMRSSLQWMTTAEEAQAQYEKDAAAATREHNKELREQEAAAKAVAREQHQLAEELRRVGEASRQAYDAENANFFKQNTAEIKTLTAGIRDDWAAIALTKEQMARREIEQGAIDQRRGVLDRGTQDNTDELLQQIEARRQLSLLMLKKDTEGVTDELQQQFLIFRQTYEDVLGGLPQTLEAQVPAITSASGEIRDVMTNDISAIGTQATQTFQMVAVVVQRTSAELRAAATQITNDLADMVQKHEQGPFGYMQFQQQTAQRLRNQADTVGFHEAAGQSWSLPGFADGVRGFRGGYAVVGERGPEVVRLPGGSDVIPGGGGGTLTIDLRGAVISDQASLDRLADALQRKLAPMFTRFGG